MLILITFFTIKTRNKQNIIFNIISTMKILYTPMYSMNQINPELNRSLLSSRISFGVATTFINLHGVQAGLNFFAFFLPNFQYGKPGSIRFLPFGKRFLIRFLGKFTNWQDVLRVKIFCYRNPSMQEILFMFFSLNPPSECCITYLPLKISFPTILVN